MLEVEPKRSVSWIFTIRDAGRPSGEVDLYWKQAIKPIPISGEPYEVDAHIYRAVCFVLLQQGQPLATVKKAGGLLASCFSVMLGGEEYSMKPVGILRRGYRIIKHGVEVGRIEPRGAMTRAARCSLPQTLPLAVRVFLVGVAVNTWGGKTSDEGEMGSC
jgi:hypothetical protein